MIRKAFTMSLHPGHEAEYKSRHNPIPDDLCEVLKSHGVHNYSINLDEKSGTLFGYAEIESEERWAAIADTESCQRWWRFMADIMETNPDASPASTALREVFHLD